MVIKQVLGKAMKFGGQEHEGWLPGNAARPLHVPVRHAVVDLQIEDDGNGNVLLICQSKNTSDSWDTWHETVEDAELAAFEGLGVKHDEWQEPDKPSV